MRLGWKGLVPLGLANLVVTAFVSRRGGMKYPMPLWLFIFLSGNTQICGAFGVILQRNPVHCLLALALTLIDVRAYSLVGLGAETLGFLQMIIYVGAIMVLFLFVIWMIDLQIEPGSRMPIWRSSFRIDRSGAALAAELSVFFSSTRNRFRAVATIARNLRIGRKPRADAFSDYLVAFKVTSTLLLAAVAEQLRWPAGPQ